MIVITYILYMYLFKIDILTDCECRMHDQKFCSPHVVAHRNQSRFLPTILLPDSNNHGALILYCGVTVVGAVNLCPHNPHIQELPFCGCFTGVQQYLSACMMCSHSSRSSAIAVLWWGMDALNCRKKLFLPPNMYYLPYDGKQLSFINCSLGSNSRESVFYSWG